MIARVESPVLRRLLARGNLLDDGGRRQAARDEAEALLREWAFVQAMTERVKNSLVADQAGCSMACQ